MSGEISRGAEALRAAADDARKVEGEEGGKMSEREAVFDEALDELLELAFDMEMATGDGEQEALEAKIETVRGLYRAALLSGEREPDACGRVRDLLHDALDGPTPWRNAVELALEALDGTPPTSEREPKRVESGANCTCSWFSPGLSPSQRVLHGDCPVHAPPTSASEEPQDLAFDGLDLHELRIQATKGRSP